MDLGLTGRVAVVTGGASGIGLAIARGFAAEGARVAVIDRDEVDGDAIEGDVVSVEADLCDPAACGTAVERVVGAFGGVDVLVNNAGVNDGVGLDRSPREFVESLERNLLHYFTMAHHCWDHLRAGDGGAVVNIGSKVASTGQGGTSGYAASKGAIVAMTREWAVDGADVGVRVNAVCPAEVWTPMYERWIAESDDLSAEAIAERIPLGRRFTEPAEIAAAVLFLSSGRASHMTGQVVFVDGGYVHLDRRVGE